MLVKFPLAHRRILIVSGWLRVSLPHEGSPEFASVPAPYAPGRFETRRRVKFFPANSIAAQESDLGP